MSTRRARTVAGASGLAVALALLVSAAVGRAQAPGAPPPHDPTMARPAAPTLGGVKDTVKDAVKQAVGGGAAAEPAPPPGTAEAAPPANDPASRAAVLRRKTLRDQDFVDSDESNRDPFKSFLRLFIDKGTPKTRQVPAVFDKFALEELTLIAIVSGDAQPRAMFRDPGGLGRSVKRGDYLSKTTARVAKILSDRVILELAEQSANGEARPVEKAVLLNPEEEAAK